MTNWEAEFDRRFYMDTDNGPEGGFILHRVNPDESVSFARAEDVKAFFRVKLDAAATVCGNALVELARIREERDLALADVAVLIDALRPFARLADECDRCPKSQTHTPVDMRIGDLQTARAAISIAGLSR